MITLPNGKICMNEQEAIQWLLNNYQIPFQCSANYAPNADIGLGTIVNPTPSKVKVGSIIFFADSKVSTVISVNETSFKCSEQYNNLVDDVAYVSNVQLNGSGHLIVSLSNGDTIDAGLIKQVSGFSVNGSQHLIVSFNDGTTSDLGAIFSGDINISGNITATGTISSPEIVESMSGYSFYKQPDPTGLTKEFVYVGVVKNGNKLTVVVALNITRTDSVNSTQILGELTLPASIGDKLFPTNIGGYNYLDNKILPCFTSETSHVDLPAYITKPSSTKIRFNLDTTYNLTLNTKYYVRYEATFLLSENLAA